MLFQGNRIIIVYYSGDADTLRRPRKSVNVVGCSPPQRSVWHKQNGLAVFVET